MFNDRLITGALAGLAGAVIRDTYSLTLKATGLTDRSFIDFAQVLVMSRPSTGIIAFLVGLISDLGVAALLGVIFAYLISFTSDKFYIFKGLGYGIIVWISAMILGNAFNFPLFENVSATLALATLIGNVIFGLAAAFALKMLSDKEIYNPTDPNQLS